jgi:hypothetical protein
MSRPARSECLSFRTAASWVVLLIACVFLMLGILFVAAPQWGAGLFGIPVPDWPGEAYPRTIGFRDIA